MTFPQYADYDGLGLADLVRKKDVSPAELIESAIERAERHNTKLNAIVYKAYDMARAAATKLPDGPFKGVPFLIKDLGVEVAGLPRTDGTAFNKNEKDTYDGLLAQRFKASGVNIFGKTNTPEFGITGTTESARLGPCRNPWNTDHITGGSSGGSAGAVAAGIVPLANASDGLGSIRIPAACCGLVGMKVTQYRVPQGPEHDASIGHGYAVHHVVSRTVRDSAAMLDCIDMPEADSPFPSPPKSRPYALEAATAPGRLRIAFTDETPSGKPVDPEIAALLRDTAKKLEALGHHVEERGLGINYRKLYAASTAVLGANFAASMRHRVQEMGREPAPEELEALSWRNWKGGERIPGYETMRGWQTLKSMTRDIFRVFATIDVLLTPVLSTPVPKIGFIDPVRVEPREVDARQAQTFGFTPPFNMTGQPSLSLPLAHSKSGLPVGMMFTAKWGDEATLYRLAGQLEQAHPWIGRKPAVWN
ncbi:MAG: amidase [Alphaproteobacteria bacterium]|nr:amidase [Alphaproteobacteria bacterium]